VELQTGPIGFGLQIERGYLHLPLLLTGQSSEGGLEAIREDGGQW